MNWRQSMRRLALVIAAAVVAGTMAAPALAQTGAKTPKKVDVFLYVDSVNGSRPVGAPVRPVSCTQTSNFTRGEQLVWRVFGSEAATEDILSPENVKYAYVKIPGRPSIKLNWGAHGAASNRVWFWTAPWIVPTDYPLGTATFRIVFKTETGTFGAYDHVVNIVPALKTPQG